MRALLYPLLASLVIPLALASENVDQGIQPPDLILPIGLATIFAAVAHLLSRSLASERHQRALVTTALIFLAYTPGIFDRLLPDLGGLHFRSLAFLALAALGGVALGMICARMRPIPSGLSKLLFNLFLLLCTYQVAHLAWGWSRAAGPPAPDVTRMAEYDPSDPDIWVIILDAYTSPAVLRRSYDLDTGGFGDELESRGFQVLQGARANYVNTVLSLASLLNRRYLDSATDNFSAADTDLLAGGRLLENNQTVRDLRRRGYRFVFFRSPFPFLSRNRLADVQIPGRVTGEFTRYWLRQTLLAPAIRVRCWLAPCNDLQAENAAEIDQKIERLTELARRPDARPKFVFAHFLLPHGPMRLTATCDERDPVWPTTAEEASRSSLRALYADQVRCANRKILELVDGLLDGSESPPVILLQGDHGYGRFPFGRTSPISRATPEQVEDRTGVFAAYFVPDPDLAEPLFWDDITPVNVLRVVMAWLREESPEPLPDRVYWSDWDRPFEFEEVISRTEPPPGP